jgi:hypothetical protein
MGYAARACGFRCARMAATTASAYPGGSRRSARLSGRVPKMGSTSFTAPVLSKLTRKRGSARGGNAGSGSAATARTRPAESRKAESGGCGGAAPAWAAPVTAEAQRAAMITNAPRAIGARRVSTNVFLKR